MALDFAAGCIGGTAGILLGYPFDTVKVMMQTQQPGARPQYTGTIQCIRSIVQRESVAGLYRGLSSPLGGVALVNAVVFGIYGNVQKRSANPDSLRTHCMAGTLAGLVQSVITSPMELTKTRMQMQSSGAAAEAAASSGAHPQHHRGAIDCARHIFRSEGWRGLYRGFSITAARDVPGFASYFVLYELLVRAGCTPQQPAGAGQTLMAGGLAGVGSWILTIPIDVVKTRLQVDGAVAGQPARYAGILDCVQQSYRAEGLRFLTRGMSSTLLRAFLMNSVCFYVVGAVIQTFDEAVVVVEPEPAALGGGGHQFPQLLVPGSGQIRLLNGGGLGEGQEQRSAASFFVSAVDDAIDRQEIEEMHEELFGTEEQEEEMGYYIAAGLLQDDGEIWEDNQLRIGGE